MSERERMRREDGSRCAGKEVKRPCLPGTRPTPRVHPRLGTGHFDGMGASLDGMVGWPRWAAAGSMHGCCKPASLPATSLSQGPRPLESGALELQLLPSSSSRHLSILLFSSTFSSPRRCNTYDRMRVLPPACNHGRVQVLVGLAIPTFTQGPAVTREYHVNCHRQITQSVHPQRFTFARRPTRRRARRSLPSIPGCHAEPSCYRTRMSLHTSTAQSS